MNAKRRKEITNCLESISRPTRATTRIKRRRKGLLGQRSRKPSVVGALRKRRRALLRA